MAQNVTFNINLRVDGKDVVKKVTMDVEELRHVVDEAKLSTTKLSESLVNFNQRSEAFRTLSDSFSQLTSTLNTLTEESREFGGAMASANTMAGKSGEEFAKMKDEVSELSKTVPIARDELANGLYQVISNGVPEGNWLEYLEKSAKASVGGMADLGEVVKVTSTLIKNYGLDWDAAGEIQDKIQLTAKNGVTSFEQMAQALPRVASQAANLGVNIDELMSCFATLTGVSGNTAEVSTQLAAIFTALIKPSSEAADMAEEMGIKFDASAIKAAGGMGNFITQLDKDVKRFAASSGMLEQEIYGRLFGSAESLRALTPLTNQLADRFEKNTANMQNSAGTIGDAFDMIASTGRAKLQLLNNKLGEVTDMIQNTFGNVLPYLNFSTQILVSLSSVAQLITSLKSLGVTINVVGMATGALNRMKVAGISLSRMLQAGYRGESVGATTAAVATRALGVAIKSLLVSTGVGIAIVALCEGVSLLSSSSKKADIEIDRFKESEDAAKEASGRVKVEIDEEIKKLVELIHAKKETTDAVKNLNDKYGDVFGSHKKASEWYDILTQKSKAYVKQIGYEAEAKVLASELAGKQIELENNYAKRRDLWSSGRAQEAKYNALTKKYDLVGSKEYEALKESARTLIPEISEIENKLGIVEVKMKEVTQEIANIGSEADKPLKKSMMNWDQVDKALDKVLVKMKQTTDPKQIKSLNNEYNQLLSRQKQLEKMGVRDSKTPSKKTNNTQEPKFYKNPKTDHELEKNINYYSGKLNGENTKEQKQIVENIQLWRKKRKEIELTQKAALVPQELKTAQDVNAKLDYLKAKKEVSAQSEQSKIDKEISKTELRGLELQRPQTVNKYSSEEDINREISYQQKLKATTEGSTETIDKEIKRLERLKDNRTELQIMQDALSDVQTEFDNATTVETKVKAKAKIEDIQREIDEATKGKLTIGADVDSTYVVTGSDLDKRQSYVNAQAHARRIETDYKIGIIGKEKAEEELRDLNLKLKELGVSPIEIVLKTTQVEKAQKKLEGAVSAVNAMGSSLSSLSSAIEVPELNVAGTLAQAIATMVAGYADATAKSGMLGPWAWLAFAATGLGQLAAMISSVKQMSAFATGGIVGGSSKTGDKLTVRVNSGEMILNAQQQARLFAIANGAALYGETLKIGGDMSESRRMMDISKAADRIGRLTNDGSPSKKRDIRLIVRGRDLIEASGNELRSTRRRSNLR